jgi:hypothetical protein
VRKLGIIALLAAGVTLALAARVRRVSAGEDAGALRVTMSCEHVDGPGRVRCEVEARAPAETSITWGDVVLLETPPFVSALRGRIGPREAVVHDPDLWRWALALVARQKGSGDVRARVRLVVCRRGECGPREEGVVGHVVAGE